MECDNCKRGFEAAEQGITTKDNFTGQELNFCSGLCLAKYMQEGNTLS